MKVPAAVELWQGRCRTGSTAGDSAETSVPDDGSTDAPAPCHPGDHIYADRDAVIVLTRLVHDL